jgi:hypothetical protein
MAPSPSGAPEKLLPNGIGTRRESSLHEALKIRYTGRGGRTEVVRKGFVCDGIDASGTIIEVQSANFAAIYKKAENLSRDARLVIVYPVIIMSFIELYDIEGKLLRRRRSPKKGSAWDIFNELVYAPFLPALKNLSIELALVDALERRVQDGRGSWRRKGISIADRSLLAFHETLSLEGISSYRRFIPAGLKGNFTVKKLAETAKIGETTARKAAYVLAKLELIEKTGKEGRAWVYRQKKAARSLARRTAPEDYLQK